MQPAAAEDSLRAAQNASVLVVILEKEMLMSISFFDRVEQVPDHDEQIFDHDEQIN